MKFTCNQQNLAKALNTVSKAVSNRTTLPVLKGILIEATEEGKLVLTASDLDISIRKEIDAVVEEAGAAVVISRLFGDIIRKLPNENILIDQTEDDGVLISTSASEFKVISLPVEEFPKVGDLEEVKSELAFDRNLFKDMVRKTAFSASIDESKGVLTGILTEINEEDVNMVSLDGVRLALVNEKITSKESNNFIISAKIMNEISRIIADEEGEDDIHIFLGEKKAIFVIDNTKVVLRMMEGEFIKYRDIIPQDGTTKVIISKELFLESIERASLLAKEGKNNLIKMSIQDNMLTITSRSEEGNVKEEIPIDKEGENLDIGFNSKFFMDVIKAIDEEEFLMVFKNSISPCVVRPVEGKSFEYLILPVRIPTM